MSVLLRSVKSGRRAGSAGASSWTIQLPWGSLPAVRLGRVYRDGLMRPTTEPGTLGEPLTLEVPTDTSFRTVAAGDVLPAALHRLGTRDHLDEQVLVGALPGGETLLLPVSVAVRALAPTRWLMTGLLEPGYLRRVVDMQPAAPGVLSLKFSREIPLRGLCPDLVRHVAYLLEDPSFRDSWAHVAQQRMLDTPSGASGHTPLRMRLPQLAAPWTVRAVGRKPFVLVLAIRRVVPADPLPYRRIEYTHPLMRLVRYVGVTVPAGRVPPSSPGTLPSGRSRGHWILDPRPVPPRDPGRPRLLGTGPLSVVYPSDLAVARCPSEVSFRRRSYGVADGEGVPSSPPPAAFQPVSLAELGPGKGGSLAAEFAVPRTANSAETTAAAAKKEMLPVLGPADGGWREFSLAYVQIATLHPEVEVSWRLREMPGSASAAGGRSTKPRRYALVGLRWPACPTAACCVLEFARDLPRSPATLLFCWKAADHLVDSVALDEFTDQLLQAGYDPHGWWRRQQVDTYFQDACVPAAWSRHRDSSPRRWAQRLCAKAARLLGLGPSTQLRVTQSDEAVSA